MSFPFVFFSRSSRVKRSLLGLDRLRREVARAFLLGVFERHGPHDLVGRRFRLRQLDVTIFEH